jgi:hypothetical protein
MLPCFTPLKESIRHPDAGKHDVKAFVNRPIPRLLRYELLLKEILGSTPSYHDDRDAIPEVIELISALARETQPGVESAKQKVELWRYNANLIFKTGEAVVSILDCCMLVLLRLIWGSGYGTFGREPLSASCRKGAGEAR